MWIFLFAASRSASIDSVYSSNRENKHGLASLPIHYLLDQISSDIPHQLEHVIVVKASIRKPKCDVLETRWVFAVGLEHRYFPFLQRKRCANMKRNILSAVLVNTPLSIFDAANRAGMRIWQTAGSKRQTRGRTDNSRILAGVTLVR